MSFTNLISEIRQKGNDGKDFEIFCKWFLLNDPYWKTQVDEVWLWDDWPQRWDRDKGVDLVFRHKNGEIWAVQSKCYAETTRITKEDVDSFLTDSNRKIISKRLLMASTNALGRNAIETMAGQEKPVIRWMLDDFENSAIVYPQALSELNKSAETKEHEDRPYQLEAVEAVVEGLTSHDRGQLIMACGTGKTFVTLWIKERLKPQTCLVLLPSLSLLSQTLHEWTANCKDEFEVLCVCSDATVGKRNTNEDLRISEAPFDVTSDPDVIRTFLKQSRPKVIFCTYQSSELIGKAQENAVIDLVVCDEAHRCAGTATASFTKVLDYKFIKAKKRLFTTATPRVFSKATVKSADDRGHQIYGMDNETVFGPILHTYSFGQAIEGKWLTDYQVLIVGVDEPTIQSYIETREIVGSVDVGIISDAETLAAKLSLLKATAEYDLKRVISFHGRVKAAKDFASEYYDLIDLVEPSKRPDGMIWTDYVSGEMSAGDRKQKIQRLKKLLPNERGLLANARCLSEGVDVPSLDGVAFIDPKGSQIDIIQAVGRALRKSDEKKFGTIVLPVFIEPGDDEIERIESSNFKPVWDVLKALRSHDERLGESIDGIRTELGKRQKSRKTLPDNIIFDLPVDVGFEFSEALQNRLIESVSESWHFWYGLLQEYAEDLGTASPPLDYVNPEGYKLGRWVINQRVRRSIRTKEEVAKLELLPGWVWNTNEAAFQRAYDHLKSYIQEFGVSIISDQYKMDDGFDLGSWVKNIRNKRKRDELPKNQIQLLEQIPAWIWDQAEFIWNQKFEMLSEYAEKNNSKTIPTDYVTQSGVRLGGWAGAQRTKRNKLPKSKIEKLESIPGWVWNVNELRWLEGIGHLKKYFDEHGDLDVGDKYVTPNGYKLGNFARRLRREKRLGKMTEERVVEVEKIGPWEWEKERDNWTKGFAHLLGYVEIFKTSRVKDKFKCDDGFNLGNWVQQRRLNKENLSNEKISLLEALPDWAWNIADEEWDYQYSILLKYVKVHGTSRVPQRFADPEHGFRLGPWVNTQRQRYTTRGTLSQEQIQRLEKLPGWVWIVDQIAESWDQGYEELETFVNKNKSSRVAQNFKTKTGFRLGSWVNKRRQNYKQNNLREEYIEQLEALPFWSWNPTEDDWNRNFDLLISYVEEHGTARVPKDFVAKNGVKLGSWVDGNRQNYKNDKLPDDKIKRLENVKGWIWSPRASRN